MPTAVSAAPAQPPSGSNSNPFRPWLARIVAALVAVAVLFPAVALSAPEPVAAGSCTGWTSTIVPPDTIRVLRRDGVVETVPFKRYVRKVMASGEWSPSLPTALLRAGAQATKQFGWYHSLKGNHRSSYVTASGKCYDVMSTTRDQLYKPGAYVYPAHRKASNAIWDLSLHRNNKFILTPYRAGTEKVCAADADGKRLYAKSARRCANKLGWSARKILSVYYTGDYQVALVSGPVGGPLSLEAAWATMHVEAPAADAAADLAPADQPFVTGLRVMW